jgi:vacuole morphology and inheritance protein 14
LKTLSDASERVVTRDLQLLAQVSSNSDDSYFQSFMVNLLSLFATDRKLLETRGSLIIRQLCVNLNPDRIYRTLAEILERDEVRTASQCSYGPFGGGLTGVGPRVCVDYGAEFA